MTVTTKINTVINTDKETIIISSSHHPTEQEIMAIVPNAKWIDVDSYTEDELDKLKKNVKINRTIDL
jgi:hypothetical protein